MKLLVFENVLTSHRGGQEISLLDVCRGLAARGHHIALAYVATGDLERAYRDIGAELVPVHGYSIDRAQALHSAANFVRSMRSLRTVAADVVYANQYLDSLLAAAVSRLRGIPFVCHLRLPPPDVLCTQFRIGMHEATRCIAISAQTRTDWASAGWDANRIDVVHNGIDTDRFSRRANRTGLRTAFGGDGVAPLFVYAGRLHPAKGAELLLSTFAIVRRRLSNARLVVAGAAAVMPGVDGRPRAYAEELRAEASRLGIDDAIVWIDHVADMPALLTAADVVIVPSRWSEPFGRVVVEAMACGTPVAATRVGGIPEILSGEFASWLSAPDDPKSLADVAVHLFATAAREPALGERARRHVLEHFTVERMAAGVERSLTAATSAFELPAAAAAVRS